MGIPEPHRFAEGWIASWNARDVEAVLAHYDDDVVFTSPLAQRVVPDSEGVARGKKRLRDYWTLALEGNPNLHFTLIAVYVGVDIIVINYQNQRGRVVNEVLAFKDGRITVGHATSIASESSTTQE